MTSQNKGAKSRVGLLGKKCGMTRIFTEDGVSLPVTVVEVHPNRITQLKSVENDGYNAIQVTAGTKKASHINKPQAGHFAKAGVEAGERLLEFHTTSEDSYSVGDQLTVENFSVGQQVDVCGVSKGKGFQGAVKRWNFRTQDSTHGNSLAHRAPGSTGMCQTPGRVFKGKKMAGQMGNKKTTVQSLEVIRVDTDLNLLLIKGAVPGATGADVIVKPAFKAETVA